MHTLRKHLTITAASVALAMGVASPAMADAPPFQVSPNNLLLCATPILLPCVPFQANFVQGNSSELLTITSPTTVSGQGFAQFTGYSLNGSAISGLTTGLNTDYGLYVTFTLTDTLTSGTIGAPGSTYNVTSLNFSLFADPNNDNVYTQANATTATPASVTPVGPQFLLGGGSLVTGTAGFDSLGGAFLNTIETYTNTAQGSLYFTQPVPFYNIAFTEFNNTTQGVKRNGNLISITNASGGVDFNRVPEPASLALLGISLIGLVVSRRRG